MMASTSFRFAVLLQYLYTLKVILETGFNPEVNQESKYKLSDL